MIGASYLLFFLSGLGGLIYQVIWVRVFGHVFGSTVYSAALVVAVFMLGLGIGSFVAGAWADRRQASAPNLLLSDYGYLELTIGLLGLAISALLPHLDQLSASVSSYAVSTDGWHVLSFSSAVARAAMCVLIVGPITIPMGATLTILIRYVVRRDLTAGAGRIALLYGANTLGAACGALLTDYALVSWLGLDATQSFAAFLNFAAAGTALVLAMRVRRAAGAAGAVPGDGEPAPLGRSEDGSGGAPEPAGASIAPVSLALALCGVAAMGMEIVWFRHFTLLLGPLRAVYSMLLAVILAGLGIGAITGGAVHRWTRRPAEWFIGAQGLLVVVTLWGMTRPDTHGLADAALAVGQNVDVASSAARFWAEMWFNLRPMLAEALVPAWLMGMAFPLANAVVQREERSVGRRAGLLYLASTAGGVTGSILAGFALIPQFGLQASAVVLSAIAWLAAAPMLAVSSRSSLAAPKKGRSPRLWMFAAATLASATTIAIWLRQPSSFVLERSLLRPAAGERLLAMHEGVSEVVAATAFDGDGRRWLLTNGYPMSSTGPMEQRYMRALAHIPLLCLEQPRQVLVIGFGVGNTTHAATLHRSVRRVDVADLSHDILSYAPFFEDANHGVLRDPRVAVFVNDGRQHLQMQSDNTYDLIALEPPPIAHAGVGALYSKQFYTLARRRLTAGGYISQWLPAYQVPAAVTLSIVRAFLDVFPQAVLLSGAQPNLLLVGTTGSSIEIDPGRLQEALDREPEVRADLARINLDGVAEIVGTFVASAQTLERAAGATAPVSDDHPVQEYSSRSLINFGLAGVPASMIDLRQVAQWCPRCFAGAPPAPTVARLDTYMAVLGRAYMVPTTTAADLDAPSTRQMIADSDYLRMLLRNAAAVRNDMGLRLASQGQLDAAVREFQEALTLRPELEIARRNLDALEVQRTSRP